MKKNVLERLYYDLDFQKYVKENTKIEKKVNMYNYIIENKNTKSLEKSVNKDGIINDIKIGYGLVENLGLYVSVITTNYIIKDSKLKLLNSANFSKKHSPENFSYQYNGEITLIIDNKPIETQKLINDGSPKLFSPDFPPIGDCNFSTYIPENSNIKIKYNINLSVNNAYVGGTYDTKELF